MTAYSAIAAPSDCHLQLSRQVRDSVQIKFLGQISWLWMLIDQTNHAETRWHNMPEYCKGSNLPNDSEFHSMCSWDEILTMQMTKLKQENCNTLNYYMKWWRYDNLTVHLNQSMNAHTFQHCLNWFCSIYPCPYVISMYKYIMYRCICNNAYGHLDVFYLNQRACHCFVNKPHLWYTPCVVALLKEIWKGDQQNLESEPKI